jgi:hypothetical protein
MAKIEYGVLLLAVAALSFTLGTNFGTAAPAPTAEAPPNVDAQRIAALEHRMDALLSERVTAAPAGVVAPAPQREVVDGAGAALAELVAMLRDALLAVPHAPATSAAAIPVPGAVNLATIQQILAAARGDGPIDNSDLVLLTLPQLLQRLGRPSRAATNSHGEIVMEFPCGRDSLHVGAKDGLVVEVYASHDRAGG